MASRAVTKAVADFQHAAKFDSQLEGAFRMVVAAYPRQEHRIGSGTTAVTLYKLGLIDATKALTDLGWQVDRHLNS